jgi:TPR repeat protein
MYQKGQGVETDYAEAMRWFREAADLGNHLAMDNIGTMYEQGLGVAKDLDESRKWHSMASEGAQEQ